MRVFCSVLRTMKKSYLMLGDMGSRIVAVSRVLLFGFVSCTAAERDKFCSGAGIPLTELLDYRKSGA